ncbi:MAG: helix-turn-helix transcriptional regulator [Niveispirillum sp.]|uniref:helix-turn-helix domain-containing protein n=1 Tax=Niveispirillum sp. TaxID=1917217 RepID=UPI0006B902D0
MSFKSRIDKRRQTYIRLLSEIAHALNQALDEEHVRRGLTQADIARTLGKEKSFVSRKLSGDTNMTLETLADLAYALDRPVHVSLPSREPVAGTNYFQRYRIGGEESKAVSAEPVRPLAADATETAFSYRTIWTGRQTKVPEHA